MVKSIPPLVRALAWAFVGVMVVVLLAPLLVVAAVSFSSSQFIVFPPVGFSLQWYEQVLTSGTYVPATLTSLKIAIAATITATLVGGAAAVALHRRLLPGSLWMEGAFLSPLVLPTIIFAIGMLMLWSTLFGPVTPLALWLGHSIVCIPYVLRTTLASLADADPNLEDAARTMGAGRVQRLLFVVLPQCAPGLGAGAFFAFNISFDEAVLSLFLRQPDLVTLPVQIYGQLEFSPDPSVAAVSTILIVLTIGLIFLIDRMLGLQRFAKS